MKFFLYVVDISTLPQEKSTTSVSNISSFVIETDSHSFFNIGIESLYLFLYFF